MLVLCTGNSCRSQMAEAYIRFFGGNDWDVFSAGVEAHGLNQRMLQVMKEDGISMEGHYSKTVDAFEGKSFDVVWTVCGHAREVCPWFPAGAELFHHGFTDPAAATGSEEEILAVFRSVRDEIKAFAARWVEEKRSPQ
jgi:arsenate reductase